MNHLQLFEYLLHSCILLESGGVGGTPFVSPVGGKIEKYMILLVTLTMISPAVQASPGFLVLLVLNRENDPAPELGVLKLTFNSPLSKISKIWKVS